MNNEKFLDISWGTIFKIGIAGLLFYLIYLVKDILIWFAFALIISVLFTPAINFLEKLKIPRSLAIVFIYIAIFGILGLAIFWTAPILVSEVQQFSQLFPQYFEKIAPPLRDLGIEAFENMESFTLALGEIVKKASSDILSALAVLFGGIGSTLFILIIAFFLSFEAKGAEKVIFLFSPKRYESYVMSIWEKSQMKVSSWFGSRVLTSLFVGLALFIALSLFNVRYALSLSLLTAVLDFIPVFGPIIAGVITVLFVVLDSWLKALFVLVVFIIIQQIEGSILSPILTKRFIGLPPVLVLLSLAIGGKLFGVLGAVLAVPLAGIIFEFLRDFLKKRKEEKVLVL